MASLLWFVAEAAAHAGLPSKKPSQEQLLVAIPYKGCPYVYKLNDNQVIVVSENSCEAASIGSYSIRLYAIKQGNNQRFLTDNFLMGLVRPRDGSIWRVTLRHDNNQHLLTVYLVACGSGSCVSADVFKIQGNKLVFLKHRDDLGCLRSDYPRV